MSDAQFELETLYRKTADLLCCNRQLKESLKDSEDKRKILLQEATALRGQLMNGSVDHEFGMQAMNSAAEAANVRLELDHASALLNERTNFYQQELTRLSQEVIHLTEQQRTVDLEDLRQRNMAQDIEGMNQYFHERKQFYYAECARKDEEASDLRTEVARLQAEISHLRPDLRSQSRVLAALALADHDVRVGSSNSKEVAISVPMTVVEKEPPNLPLYMSSMPPRRGDALAAFSGVQDIPSMSIYGSRALFSRALLSDLLGGSVQNVLVSVNVKKHKPLAIKHNITGYLCPNHDHNPWCPTQPGMHGYMFVGLGREANTFAQTETKHVFVSVGVKQYRYIGLYEASRVQDGLTVEEWDPLPENFKNKYSATTADKTIGNTRSAAQTKAAYDSGELHVPCVQLKCVGFSDELFSDLVNMNGTDNAEASAAPSKRSNEIAECSGEPKRKSARR